MFFDYRKLVIECYEQLKARKLLRSRLVRPTPGNVKKECLAICKERYLAKDGKCLGEFFGQRNDQKAYLKAIQDLPADKFKPIVYLLKGITTKPDDNIFELVAWLIDLEPRPFDDMKDYDQSNITIAGKKWKPENDKPDNKNKPADTYGKSGKPYFSFRTYIVIASILIIVAAGVILYRMQDNNKPPRNKLSSMEKCMYWVGDHYEQVSCNQKLGDTLVIAFDSLRFHQLKRIIKPDTITLKSIGRVWYIKQNNQFEFFTWGGYHPADPKMRLRPITDYIIRKYLLRSKEIQ